MQILTRTTSVSHPPFPKIPLYNVSHQVVAYYKAYRFIGIYIENPTYKRQMFRIFGNETLLGFALVEAQDSRLYFFDKQMTLNPRDVHLEEHLEEYIYED
ncbi:hypothetical protein AB1I63_09480 [Streptococcus pneumoniae]